MDRDPVEPLALKRLRHSLFQRGPVLRIHCGHLLGEHLLNSDAHDQMEVLVRQRDVSVEVDLEDTYWEGVRQLGQEMLASLQALFEVRGLRIHRPHRTHDDWRVAVPGLIFRFYPLPRALRGFVSSAPNPRRTR